jgi:hypothetical protein
MVPPEYHPEIFRFASLENPNKVSLLAAIDLLKRRQRYLASEGLVILRARILQI